MLLIDPHQMHVILILSLDLFCYEVQTTPGGSAEWVYCKWSFPPVLVHLSHLHPAPQPPPQCFRVLYLSATEVLRLSHCSTEPHDGKSLLSLSRGVSNKGVGDKLWDMWANSDICLVFWPLWLLRKWARASWPVENPPPTGEKGEGVAWTASDKGTCIQGTV